MIRLLLRLLKIQDFETCKSCEILKQQLLLVNAEKKELTETILNLIQPKIFQPPPIHLPAEMRQATNFSRRRNELEKQHAVSRDIRNRSPFIAKPNNVVQSEQNINPETIDAMEAKLGLNVKE